MPQDLSANACRRCGKWAGAHATLPGQPRDHLCMCPAASVAPDNFTLTPDPARFYVSPAARHPSLATRADLEDRIDAQAAEIARLTAERDGLRAEVGERCIAAIEALPPHRWADGSDQWGQPCPAKVATTRADYIAAIRAAIDTQRAKEST